MKGLKKRPVGYYSSSLKDKYQPPLQLFVKSYPKRLLKQTIIAVLIFISLLSIKLIDNRFDKNLVASIQGGLNKSFNYKDTYRHVVAWGEKIVLQGDKVVSVLNIKSSGRNSFLLPMAGNIVGNFMEKDTEGGNVIKGILIEGDNDRVMAAQEGVVLDINNNKSLGHYIVIKHKGELLSVYKYLEEVNVEINQKVEKGDLIGKTTKTLLYEIWLRKEPVDPMDYFKLDSISNI